MRSLTPPIAMPISLAEVADSLRGERASGASSFPQALCEATGYSRVDCFGSGRAGLTSLLGSWSTPARDEVVVAGYTCWSVPASVVRAGLKVRLVDVDPHTFDIPEAALRNIPWSRVCAVVAPHLLDRTCDVEKLCRLIRDVDPAVRIVEDSAQTWPAGGAQAADAMLLSFDRGKPLPLGGGGAILHREGKPLAARSARSGGAVALARLVAAMALSRPSLFRLAESVPFLGVGGTVYDAQFTVREGLYTWQQRLGLRLLRRIEALTASRCANAARLAGRVRRAPGWIVPGPARPQAPIRLAALAPDGATRSRVVAGLRSRGVGASTMYPGPIADIPELQAGLAGPSPDLTGAREIASRLVTLPIFPALSLADIDRIGDAFADAAA